MHSTIFLHARTGAKDGNKVHDRSNGDDEGPKVAWADENDAAAIFGVPCKNCCLLIIRYVGLCR